MAKTPLPTSVYHSGAIFSDCRQYRYALWRKWDASRPNVMFIGLNPSQAGSTHDDPTIRRMRIFAQDWGFGGVYVMNLFAYMTPYPEVLKKCKDPVGKNAYWLERLAPSCDKITFAWGVHGHGSPQAETLIQQFPHAWCMGMNKSGSPRHPLYLRKDTQLEPFGRG